MRITNGSPSNIRMVIHGLLSEVKLNGGFQSYGSSWHYINGGTDTQIDVNSNTLIYGSFNVTGISNRSFTLSGYVYGNTAFFYPPTIYLLSPTSINMTSLGLYNSTQLLSSHNFPSGLIIHSGSLTTINWNFTDINTGLQSYKLKALVSNGTITTLIQSSTQDLNFGNQIYGNLTIGGTNPNVFPFKFVKTVVNSTATNLDVFYPATYNTTCNLSYEFAMTNKNYTNLPVSQATFQFNNLSNEIVTINCFDVNTLSTGKYIITETTMPFIQEAKDFKAGKFGTSGSFGGVIDLITLLVVIISMIGLNRVNEAVAAIFSLFIIGACAFFGLIEWFTVITSAVAVVIIIVITQVRKQQGF